MAVVKFYTVDEGVNLPNQKTNGAIYFSPSSINNSGTIFYDMDNIRYQINKPNIYSLQELSQKQDWVPRKGEIVVVTDAYMKNNEPFPYIKIGDGETNCLALPYLVDSIDIDLIRHINDAMFIVENNNLNINGYDVENHPLWVLTQNGG